MDHGCGLWRSISEGWENFSKHLSFVVGDCSHILFWHDKWIRDNSLITFYSQLFVCLANKEACIYDVLSPPVGGNDRVSNLRFNDWELAASFSFLHLIQSWIPRGGGCDSLCWSLNGSGKFDTYLFIIRFKMLLFLFSLRRAFGK